MRPKTFRSLFRNSVNTPAVLAMSFAAATFASADATWVGDTSQDWNDATNWSSDPSNPTGNFFINTATGNYPILSANSAFTPVDLIIANGAGVSGRFDQTAGSVSLANTTNVGNWFKVGQAGGTGTYNLADTSSVSGGITGFGQGSGSLTVGKFFVGGAYFTTGGTGTVNINTTGTLQANSTQSFTDGAGGQNASIVVGRATGASGTLNLQNGTVNSAGDFWVGSIGTGTVNQTGGVVNVSGALLLSRNNNNTQAGVGTWNVSGTGQVNIENDFIVAYAGNSSAVGAMNINAGAVVNVASATERWLIVNRWDTAQGQLTVDGGTLNLNANTDIRFSSNNGTGTSFVTLKNGGAINGGATSVVDLMQANVAGNNTFNLDGGTLTVSQVMTNQNSGTAAFNFNGGTLKASNDNANFVDLGGAGQTANVLAGGAIIDSNGHNVTIVEGLKSTGGDGGLTKNGAGDLTLSGTNTYTGATTVNAGKLIVNGNTSTSILTTVNDGATLGGSGTLGAVTVLSGGTMAPGNSPGTINVGNFDLQSGSTLAIELAGNLPGTEYDQVNVTGTATLAGLLNVSLSFTPANEDLFFILLNDGTDSISGTFSGLADNDTFFADGQEFQISYFGDSATSSFTGGNDVVLKAIPEPTAALMGSLGLLALLRRRRK